MHLFMVLLFSSFGAAVHATSRISQPALKAVNFAKAIEGRRLKGSVIKEVEVDSEDSCQIECVKEENCQSYNFGDTKSNTKRFKCQVNSLDRFVGHANFTKDEKFKYRGMKVILQTCIFFNFCFEFISFERLHHMIFVSSELSMVSGLLQHSTTCMFYSTI